MADDTVWVKSSKGELRGFHPACADWLHVSGSGDNRQAYHTELCRGCGRFLDAAPPEHTGPPLENVEILLG